MSTATREVKDLEVRLSAAREKAAKESHVNTFAARQDAAQTQINDGESRLNKLNRRARETADAIDASTRNSTNAEVGLDSREAEARRAVALQHEQEKLAAELGETRAQIDAARSVLSKVRAEIEAHPIYAAARKEQRELCERAVGIAGRVWGGAIEDAVALNRDLEAISQEEQNVVARWRPKLEAEGLPLVRARLHSQIGNLVPVIFLSTDFRALRADCDAAAVNVLRDF